MAAQMSAMQTMAQLALFERRGPGTDAERRAARWLASELTAAGREVQIETFWCRPNWALAQAVHLTIGLGGSLATVKAPRVGGALLVIAMVCMALDALLGTSPGRWLTPLQASQNVIATGAGEGLQPVRLMLTANYDAGRTGTLYGEPVRRAAAFLRRATGGRLPGWLGWLMLALLWLLGAAIARLQGLHGQAAGALQLVPSVGLVLAIAALVETGTAGYGPAAGDNGSGVAVALALARALDVAPPRSMSVDVVLQGAGEGGGLGLRRYLRARKSTVDRSNTVVLGLAACGSGPPRWWLSDGSLVPLRYHKLLVDLCAEIATEHPLLQAAPYRGRGATPALRARPAGVPAIAIGCLNHRGVVPRSHRYADVTEAVDPDALDAALHFGVLLIDALDQTLDHSERQPSAAPRD